MYAPRPIITRLDSPAEMLSLELIKEYIGLDPDIDAEQDRALPVLRQAAIDQGQQITGTVWAAASYRIDGLCAVWPGAGFRLPLAPVFDIGEIVGRDGAGADVTVAADAYSVIPSAIDLGRPWAELHTAAGWPERVQNISVTCVAGWTADKLPESLRAWMLTRIATLYDIRADAVTGTTTAAMPRSHVDGLLDRWMVKGSPYA